MAVRSCDDLAAAVRRPCVFLARLNIKLSNAIQFVYCFSSCIFSISLSADNPSCVQYVYCLSSFIFSISLSADNPRWVGAWWIGFIISGCLAFIIALPIAGFPKALPGTEAFKAEKEKEVYSKAGPQSDTDAGRPLSTVSSDEGKQNVNKILKSVKILVTNPTFMFLNLAAACEGNYPAVPRHLVML